MKNPKYSMRSLLLIALFVYTADGKPGESGHLFLRMNPAAKPAAMAGAYSALSYDPGSIYFNPAGLSRIYFPMISLQHSEMFADQRMENLSLAWPFTKKIVGGIGINYHYLPSIQGFDAAGQKTSAFNPADFSLSLAASYKISGGFRAGLALKYFQEDLASYSAKGFAADLGLMYVNVPSAFSFGLVVQNLGPSAGYTDTKEDLPLTIRAGGAYLVRTINLLISTDVVYPLEEEVIFKAGIQAGFFNKFFLRAGYDFNPRQTRNMSFGLGIPFLNRYILDYAFLPDEYYNGTHMFAVTIRLN